MAESKFIKVFLCSCNGTIDKAVSFNDIAGSLGIEGVVCHNHLCSPEGIEFVNNSLGPDDSIVIAACSPFYKQLEFAQLKANRFNIHRVNIREQCAYIHSENPDNASKKAETLIKMGIEGARTALPVSKGDGCICPDIAVIGGGVAGINAALSAIGAGLNVLLLERDALLGGKVKELHSYFPRMCPPSCGLDLMYERLIEGGTHISTLSELLSVTGAPGNLALTYRKSPRFVDERRCTLCGECLKSCPNNAVYMPEHICFPASPTINRRLCQESCSICSDICPAGAINLKEVDAIKTFKAGAIIAATGWDGFDPSVLTEYSYGSLKGISTNLHFEQMLKDMSCEKKTTAFIQCVGSRDEKHLPYCSGVCCMVSIKQALTLKNINPDNEVYIFYNDIRTPGEYELFYRRARNEGVRFIKGIPSDIAEADSGRLGITVYDTSLNKRINIEADQIVLATGMKSSEGTMLLKQTPGISLNLNENGFVASHLQCLPQDSLREGIFSAGACRGPMDVSASIESASSAVLSAIGFINKVRLAYRDFPHINTEKCDKCKRCIEECPHAAYSLDEKGFPVPEGNKCRRCGSCMGSCPLGAISIGSLGIEQLSAMIDAIDVSMFGDDEPLILAFLCRNDAYRAVDDIARIGKGYEPNVLSIPLPCAGAINGLIAAKALSSGIDGIMVCGCEDAQCHFARGSDLAKERIKSIRDKLTEMFLEPERARFCTISRDGASRFVDETARFLKELRLMGRNPLRMM